MIALCRKEGLELIQDHLDLADFGAQGRISSMT